MAIQALTSRLLRQGTARYPDAYLYHTLRLLRLTEAYARIDNPIPYEVSAAAVQCPYARSRVWRRYQCRYDPLPVMAHDRIATGFIGPHLRIDSKPYYAQAG